MIDKLDVWRKLVPEVWVWEGDELSFYVARGERYVRRERSKLLPTFDPALMAECMTAPTQTEAVKRLRKKLRRR